MVKRAEAEADGGVGLGVGEAEGAEDMRGFRDAGGAGGAGGGGEVGWRAPKISCATKPSNCRLALPGCRRSRVGPLIRYWIGASL